MSNVDHPKHYQLPGGIEAIQICEWLPFNLGNCIKYILRLDHKIPDSDEDLDKAVWCLKREKQRRQAIRRSREERPRTGEYFERCQCCDRVALECIGTSSFTGRTRSECKWCGFVTIRESHECHGN
jgi:hypothetical protein